MKTYNKNFYNSIEQVAWRYQTPSNLSYFWNFGFLSFICLMIQIVTGIFLAMHYIPDANSAFNSIEAIMRNVEYGWFFRYAHANGASFFFFCVYVHLFRNIYYFSYLYPRSNVWIIGMFILVLMILTAFLGYVLPWGQMSFWAATVITSLFSAIPIIGDQVVVWLWGGYAVEKATLIRFYSLHYLLPFVILFLVIIHVILLHTSGSSNPMGLVSRYDYIAFGPYFIIKDFISLLIFFFLFIIVVCFYPNVLGHPDNYIMANPLVTPAHIVPEWYFLPFYAILRSIPNKLGGILILLYTILLLFFLPWIIGKKNIWRCKFTSSVYNALFTCFIIICFLLGWLGGQPIDYPYVEMGQLLTILYISYLLGGVWFCELIDKWIQYFCSLQSKKKSKSYSIINK